MILKGKCDSVGGLTQAGTQEFEGSLKVVKVEVDGNPDLVSKYKVFVNHQVQRVHGGDVHLLLWMMVRMCTRKI